jgi:hypothetical protein
MGSIPVARGGLDHFAVSAELNVPVPLPKRLALPAGLPTPFAAT